jgi:hypothetical protein
MAQRRLDEEIRKANAAEKLDPKLIDRLTKERQKLLQGA